MATLITGGAGYVGSHTVVALHAAGRDVVVLDDFSNARRDVVAQLRLLTTPDLIVVEGDAADRSTVRGIVDEYDVDAIVHFAAHKSVEESVSQPLRYFANNVMSTLALAEAAVESDVERIVFSSSATVYGSPAALPVTEDSPTEPENPYGASKLMCERILSDTASASNVRVVLLRYFNPVGAHPSAIIGERPVGTARNLIPVVMQVASGELAKLKVYGGDYATRDGTTVRDYVHVMDLAAGHAAALDADLGQHPSRVFNLGTGEGTTVLEIVGAARDVVQRPVPYEIVGRRPGDVAASWADCSRAHAELGWRAELDLAEMLTDQWRFARQWRQGLA